MTTNTNDDVFHDIWMDGWRVPKEDPFALRSSSTGDQPFHEDGSITDSDFPGDGDISQRSAPDFPQLFTKPQHSIPPDNNVNIDLAPWTLNKGSLLSGFEDFSPIETRS